MKKFFSLFILAAVLYSCESDVKFSDPGFQGRKDNFAWRADLSSAHFEATDPNNADPNLRHDGFMTVYAYKGLEEITLRFPFNDISVVTKFNPLEYQLGPTTDVSDDIKATYSFEDNGFVLAYSTGEAANGEDSIGNATIIVNEYDNEKQTLSGTFKFNVKYEGDSAAVPENVNFQEGVFYHVQIN